MMIISTVNNFSARSLGRVALCCLLFASSLVNAQTDSFKRDTTKKLKEVKVSSSPAPKMQTVSPAQQINSADFIKYNAFNVADAIRDFAGVNVKDYGGIGGLKTVSVRSLGADNTAVLYNGIQLNDAQNGQIDLSKFNLNNIQKITLYNAMPDDILQTARAYSAASVLSVETVKPHLTANKPYEIQLGYKGGSFGLANPYLQWQQRINNYWSFVVNGFVEEANGRYKYDNRKLDGSDTLAIRRNGDVHVQQASAGLYWAKSDSNKLDIEGNFYHSHQGLPAAVVLYANPVKEFLYNQDEFVQGTYRHIAKNSFELLLNARVLQNYTRFIDDGLITSTGPFDQHAQQREAYGSAAVAYKLFPFWKLSFSSDADVAGLDMNEYQNYSLPTRLSLYNALASDITAGKWRIQASLLNAYINDYVKTGTSGGAKDKFLPTVVLSYKPLTDTAFSLRTYYKSTYRYPTFSDLYYYNPTPRNLKPEFSQQYDLGAAYTKTLDGAVDFIQLSADAYFNRIKDKIVYLPGISSPQTPSATNLGTVDIKGLDATLKSRVNVAYQWKAILSATYTYQQALNVTNPTDSYYLEQIPYTPRNTLALNAGIDHNGIGLYYNQVLASSRYQNNDNLPEYYLPAYSVSDASLVYHFLVKSKPVMVSAEVNNLFNKEYDIVAYYPMPGRSVRFTLQITI